MIREDQMFDADKIAAETINRVMQHWHWKFGAQLWFVAPMPPTNQPHPLEQSPLREQITMICRAANGELARDDDVMGELGEMIQSLAETLYSTPLDNSYSIPASFWATELGQAVLHAQLWLRNDELITLTEAAKILRGSTEAADRMWVVEQIRRGRLTRYVDPTEPNPQKSGRASRQEVEALANA